MPGFSSCDLEQESPLPVCASTSSSTNEDRIVEKLRESLGVKSWSRPGHPYTEQKCTCCAAPLCQRVLFGTVLGEHQGRPHRSSVSDM